MPDYENVVYEVRDHVAHITMNHPETLNTLTTAMIKNVDSAMREADKDHDVHVIVFLGAGRGFSAGHDLSGRPREIPENGPRPGTAGG